MEERFEFVGEIEESRARDPIRVELDDQATSLLSVASQRGTEPKSASPRTP